MKLKKILALGVLAQIAILAPTQSFAAKFANQFTEFELPPQWQCNLEGAEWVCQSTNEAKKKDAIIVLAAKLKGDQDSLDQYESYLKGSKSWTSIQGKPVKSEVKYAKMQAYGGQTWVDSLHLESEIPGFFTRYLATVKNDIGVLITYSVNKNKYQDYVNDFNNMIATLKVFRNPGQPINARPQDSNIFAAGIPTNVQPNSVFQVAGGADATAPRRKQDDGMMMYLLVGAAVVLFIVIKRRKSGGGQ